MSRRSIPSNTSTSPSTTPCGPAKASCWSPRETEVLIEAGNVLHTGFAGLVIADRLHGFWIPHDLQCLNYRLQALPGDQERHRAAMSGNGNGRRVAFDGGRGNESLTAV